MRETVRSLRFVAIAILAAACSVRVGPSGTPVMPPSSPSPTAASSAAATPEPSPTAGQPSAGAGSLEGWFAAAPMPYAPTGFDALVLGDGTVLAVGDDWDCQPGGALPGSERTWLYDPVADRWHEGPSLNRPRKVPATVPMLDGGALVLGGRNADDIGYSSTKFFSPDTQTWTDGPALTFARAQPTAVSLPDGRVLAVGTVGMESGNNETVELFDPFAGSWQLVAPIRPGWAVRQLLTLANGRILAVGTDHSESEPFPVAFLYDSFLDQWTEIEAPTTPLGAMLVSLPDGSVLALGGEDGGEIFGGDGSAVRTAQRFDPGTHLWADTAPLLEPRLRAQVAVLPDGRVLVAGGERVVAAGPPVTLSSTELYDPAIDAWSPGPDLLAPRRDGFALPLTDGSVLVLGGTQDHQDEGSDFTLCPEPMDSVERYLPG